MYAKEGPCIRTECTSHHMTGSSKGLWSHYMQFHKEDVLVDSDESSEKAVGENFDGKHKDAETQAEEIPGNSSGDMGEVTLLPRDPSPLAEMGTSSTLATRVGPAWRMRWMLRHPSALGWRLPRGCLCRAHSRPANLAYLLHRLV